MKLSEHFDLSEFTHSATAERHHITNTIDLSVQSGKSVFENIQRLCVKVLEPLRQHFNTPITINSGYRCPELNRLVGGSPNSYHLSGRAADIPFVPAHLAYIRDHLPHKELINEGTWIHVAL